MASERAKKPKESSQKAEERDISGKKRRGNNEKQVFSFRALVSDINIWKAYVNAVSGGTMEKICSEAMNEYINAHKLSGAELAVFEALKKREKM